MAEIHSLGGGRRGDGQSDLWLRRQAVVIVAQLPDGPDDALRVLELARDLVRSFLGNVRPV